jgi:hypothetical protein
VDGGVLANTPVNEAIEFAKKIYDRSDVNFVLISLGTGSALSSAEALPAYFSYKKENGKSSMCLCLKLKQTKMLWSNVQNFMIFLWMVVL